MTLKELEAKVQALEARTQALEDIDAIKKLQNAYAYYLQRWEWRAIVALFSDAPDASVETGVGGNFVGKKEITRRFREGHEALPPEFMHAMVTGNGIVEVAPDGKTGKSRYYALGPHAGTGPHPENNLNASWSFGIWQNDYVKEGGVWKIKRLYWNFIFHASYEDGWGKKTIQTRFEEIPRRPANAPPYGPDTVIAPYPSGYLLPYFFKHPVTGK